MKLFAIYIGGTHEKAVIELHDLRFVIAEKIEDTFEELQASWWGTKDSLHLDAWGELNYADGFEIKIEDLPSGNNEYKLYFVNLGGYDKNEFTELHKNVFVVAQNESKAKVRALRQILDWESHHRDYQFELEKIVDISSVVKEKKLYLNLVKSDEAREFQFVCKYVPIGAGEN